MSESVFFSIRVIDERNSLPGSVIHANTVNTFKAKTDCLFRNRGYIYKLLASFLLSHLSLGGLLSLSLTEFTVVVCVHLYISCRYYTYVIASSNLLIFLIRAQFNTKNTWSL